MGCDSRFDPDYIPQVFKDLKKSEDGKITCPECKGAGYTDCYVCDSVGTLQCDECEGTGTMDQEMEDEKV